MAVNINSFIRVRLFFDYPPPAVADCRMCWLLVDLKTCRVVADVESLIRDKFHFSSRSLLSLFIDDCYLPHTEHVLLLRDNDNVRVKVDSMSQVNGRSRSSDRSSKSCKKRKRPADDDGPTGTGLSLDQEEKQMDVKNSEVLEELEEVNKEKKKKKKKKKKKTIKEKTPHEDPKQTPTPRESPVRVQQPVKRTNNPPTTTQSMKPITSSSESSRSASVEDEAPKRPPAPKPAAKTPSSATPAGSKTNHQTPKPKPATHPASSSSQTDSSSDDDVRPKKNLASNKPFSSSPPKTKPHNPPPSELQLRTCADPNPPEEAPVPPDSDSEDEIKLVIKKPTQLQGFAVGGQQAARRGGGQGRRVRCGHGYRGKDEGQGLFGGRAGSLESSCDGNTKPSYQTDILRNTSRIVQNGVMIPPKKDYSSMPLLAAPPQVGQKIAFKLLELAENYTPEISDYKEGRIVNFDPTTRQIELELLHVALAPVEPGKFDLVYQNPDGSERVEYAVSRGDWVIERWDSLLDPRLII